MTYFEDVQEGMLLASVTKQPTTQQLVKYAGASGDYNPIHYDKDHALNTGLPGVIVHGALKGAFLAQVITDFAGETGSLKQFSCEYRGMDVPGDTLTCKGRVMAKRVQDGENIVECEVWLENGKGEKTTNGRAVVAFPSRNQGGP